MIYWSNIRIIMNLRLHHQNYFSRKQIHN